MDTLYLDTETFCAVPIGNGSHAYAEKAEVLLATYAWDDGPVECLDFTDSDKLSQLETQIARARLIVIHNSSFDRTVLRWQGIEIEPERLYDTMVQAYLHSLPGGLGPLCDVLGVPTDKAKDKDGKRLIHLFCKPLPKNSILRRATRLTHPEEWERFKTYAMLDVEAMRAARKAMPVWNFPEPGSNTGDQREVRLWQLDQKINDRGFAVDTVLAEAAVRAAKRASKSLAARTAEITEDQVQATTQRDALLKYFLEEHDLTPPDLKKGTVRDLLKLELPTEVRELLENRLQASATAPAKYGALLKSVSSDTRLRGTIQFAGAARTARFSGRIFQPHNLPRPTMKGPAIEAGIRAIKAGTEDLIYDNVMDLCGNAVRGCVVAPEGHKLVIADLSNIEGRVLAWLAGEQWKLDAFRDYDTVLPDGTRRGHDLYKIGAGLILGKQPEDVTDDERQISGKIPELACGYAGGLGAFKVMAALYAVNLSDDAIRTIVGAFRKRNNRIVALWYALEKAVRLAIQTPGEVYRLEKLSIRCDGTWLRIRLPSGRYLCYPGVELDEDGAISYLGTNQYTRKWERIRTYGGKLVENVTQAVARDILTHGMEIAERAGYAIVLHVHDEIISETPDTPQYTSVGLAACMSQKPYYAMDLPLSAAGFETLRYRKG